jgi:sulfur-oxidizing protein SoxY
MAQSRRTFFRNALVLGGSVWAARLLRPQLAKALPPGEAAAVDKLEAAITEITGGRDLIESDRITIEAPDTAEDGAVVPVAVQTTLPGVETIALIVEKNPFPLAASFRLAKNAEASVSLRLKMNETGDVLAIVQAGDRFYEQRRRVNVVVGGCG